MEAFTVSNPSNGFDNGTYPMRPRSARKATSEDVVSTDSSPATEYVSTKSDTGSAQPEPPKLYSVELNLPYTVPTPLAQRLHPDPTAKPSLTEPTMPGLPAEKHVDVEA
ncbi:MAG: hypothetical protein D6679_12240 [Candidatus Hydrogenedentota bacterium]|nr:MAG: hypothetical protein D6679_12240 [Candidatus Hydrogenedentota bacterium]